MALPSMSYRPKGLGFKRPGLCKLPFEDTELLNHAYFSMPSLKLPLVLSSTSFGTFKPPRIAKAHSQLAGSEA